MKGVQIVEPNKLQIVDLEKPQIDKENNVLVRMVAAGISERSEPNCAITSSDRSLGWLVAKRRRSTPVSSRALRI